MSVNSDYYKHVDIMKLLPPALQLQIIKQSSILTLAIIKNLNSDIQFTLLDSIRVGLPLKMILPAWKREYYPQLEKTGIAAQVSVLSQEELNAMFIEEYKSSENSNELDEIKDIIRRYQTRGLGQCSKHLSENEEKKKTVEMTLRLKNALLINSKSWRPQIGRKYNYNELHDTRYAPANVRAALDILNANKHGIYDTDVVWCNTLIQNIVAQQNQYRINTNRDIIEHAAFEDEYINIYIKEILTYFDKHGYEFFYFDLYMKDDPGLRSRNRFLPKSIIGTREPRLYPTPQNFEEASGGPNKNFDMYVLSSRDWRDFASPSNASYYSNNVFYDEASILTWSKRMLAGTIRTVLNRLPTWEDLGMQRPFNRKFLYLPGFARRFTPDQLINSQREEKFNINMSNYLHYDVDYYMSLARIFLGAYDYWLWNDIKRRKYYHKNYLQWIAVFIYLYDLEYVRILDYDKLVDIIKDRAVRRRIMIRPVTMPKTRKFFGL